MKIINKCVPTFPALFVLLLNSFDSNANNKAEMTKQASNRVHLYQGWDEDEEIDFYNKYLKVTTKRLKNRR